MMLMVTSLLVTYIIDTTIVTGSVYKYLPHTSQGGHHHDQVRSC